MSPIRLVIVTRQFWPATSMSEISLFALACALSDCGVDVRVLTPRWSRAWNHHFTIHGVDVTRLPRPSSRRWRSEPFSKALKQWLADHARDFDAVLLWDAEQDYPIVEPLLEDPVKMVARIDLHVQAWTADSVDWLNDSPSMVKRENRRIVCNHKMTEKELAFLESANHLVSLIPDTLPFEIESPLQKTDCRLALQQSHQMLAVGVEASLGIYWGEVSEDLPWHFLIDAWKRVVLKRPDSMFWVIGKGNGKEQLWKILLEREMQHNVIIVGDIDAPTELFTAADFVVSFDQGNSISPSARLARALGLPVVEISDTGMKDHGSSSNIDQSSSSDQQLRELERFAGQLELASQQNTSINVTNAQTEFDHFVNQYRQLF